MKINYYNYFLNIILVIIFLVNYIYNRELESPEIILKNLYRFLNTGFNPNQTILINNKYYFDISFIQPILNYTNYTSNNVSITIIEPKLILYFNSKLYIPFKSKFFFCGDNNESNNNLIVSILMKVNFSNIMFNKLEDNSYVIDYHFNYDDFSGNSKIIFNYIENFLFSKYDINLEEKKKMLDIYIDNIKLYLEQYPVCDGLFLFNITSEYMIRTKKFNSTWCDYYYFERPEILSLSYERHTKIENIKSKIINVKIKVYYEYCDEFSVIDFCYPRERTCIINDILIYKKNITYGNFEKRVFFCEDDDEMLIKYLINLSKNAMIPFL